MEEKTQIEKRLSIVEKDLYDLLKRLLLVQAAILDLQMKTLDNPKQSN